MCDSEQATRKIVVSRLQRLVDNKLAQQAATKARLVQLDNELEILQSQLEQATDASMMWQQMDDVPESQDDSRQMN